MVKSLNWNNITSSGDGDFTPLPAGAYVAVIVDAIDNEAKEYVEVIFDIAEGEHKGYYSDDWGKAHPYAHHFFMSYKEKALGMLKGRLEAIQSSNPGFDPFAAWDAGRIDMLKNRVVGINLQEEEYEYQGDVKTRLNVCQVLDAQKVRDGKVKVREKKLLDGKTAKPTSRAKTYDDESDIPFD
jgi:hypothetical protein